MNAIIALGSNMGDRRKYIEEALRMIDDRAGRITAISDIIETKAYGMTQQEDFLNLAISLETALTPLALLEVLHEIEAALNRVRVIHWGPRTIDLDIIFYENQIIDREDLHIPHADFANRTFVLGPIVQIAPDLVDPRSGKSVSSLYEELLAREEA